LPRAENTAPQLQKLVAEQEEESAEAVAKYQPEVEARIDDLGIQAEGILRQLPRVVQVEVTGGSYSSPGRDEEKATAIIGPQVHGR
jgi:hypothetical protein